MDKFIGFDIEHKHTLACLVQAGQPDRYRKFADRRRPTSEWLNFLIFGPSPAAACQRRPLQPRVRRTSIALLATKTTRTLRRPRGA